ncbi:MAG: sigma-54-dependent Fis family transcriptional regulator, partial [Oscillospiraceae bacterium]|nr:sigma-54-dependent Fis family transcriptional regulator [Oscillospiraceae bacterium]
MDIAKMTELWADFVFEGKLSPEIRYPISDAWQKCRAAGVNPSGGEGRRIDVNILESARKENQMLISLALPVMREIFEIVRVSGFLVVLTDAAGYILEMMGDDEIISKSNDMRFMPGAKWSNLEVGTNAISLALDYDMPIQTIGPEHYCVTHHGWTCSAAPIHDVYGEVVGCINLSGDREKAHLHTLGMAQAAAIGIEGQLREARNALMMHKVLESSQDCILLFDQKYAPTWMNSAAKELLKCDLDSLREKGIQSVIPSADLTQLKSRMDESFFSDNVAVLVDGETIYCSITVCPMADRYCAFSVTMRPQTQLIQTANKLSGNRASYTFHNFLTENEKMKKTLSMAERFARYEGNILIQGESGTGKEVLAQAIHNAGANADGPFVTVNCASIPLDLFEMELFGYDPVAFPGRAAEGKPGRFELADKGTLFLDAVSAIPLDMQIKLLQAVETHTIQRLGSNNPIKLDIRIIAAS